MSFCSGLSKRLILAFAAKCIDEYAAASVKTFESNEVVDAPNPKLVAVVERMLDK